MQWPAGPQQASVHQAAPACGTIAPVTDAPSLVCCGNRMVFLFLGKDGPEAMYIVVFKQNFIPR